MQRDLGALRGVGLVTSGVTRPGGSVRGGHGRHRLARGEDGARRGQQQRAPRRRVSHGPGE
ncbi:hypothetical protein [Streptomyces mirabilis]|uniref:hypothetical protein n=1 Tax=Streptomyces mirabilis TaxID=68239 RepID=UPI0031BADA8A